jgi:exosortase/archaeosortase family protein
MTALHLPQTSRSRGPLAARAAVGAATLVAGLLVMTSWSYRYREMEATLAAHLTDVFTPSFSFGDRWVVEPADGKSLLLVVTPSCTTGLLAAPLFVAGVWGLLLRRLRISLTMAGLVLGLAVLLTLGTIRMSLIGLAWHRWGRVSAWVSHDLVGTLITVLSAALALGVMLTVASRGSHTLTREFTDEAPQGGR